MMQTPVLCIVQARLKSTRLENKMLLKLGDETLIERGHRIACDAFGAENVVVAIPASDEAGPLGDELRRIGARIFAWAGDERDVLGRFHACAHTYRWHPDSIIVRYTPDDHRKSVDCLRMVANGERLPVEIGGEAFTLSMLSWADNDTSKPVAAIRADDGKRETFVTARREHISHALFSVPALPAPDGYTIDTQADYDRAKAWVAENEPTFHFTHGPYTT